MDVIRKRLLVRAALYLRMHPLAVVEARLGSVDSWPSYVLRYMFLLEPDSRVTKVAAFIYGNNVRRSDAVTCYNELTCCIRDVWKPC